MISQYANSPILVKLVDGLKSQYNSAKTIEDWFKIIFNLKTASGIGLDVWGEILNQSRSFTYEDNGVVNTVVLQGGQTIDGITYTDEQIENLYRTILFLRTISNISGATIPSMNELFQYYFKDREGRVYILEYATMEIRYVFEFYVSKFEKTIFSSDIMPKPTGVLSSFSYIKNGDFFGFYVNGLTPENQPYAPFDNKPFYW